MHTLAVLLRSSFSIPIPLIIHTFSIVMTLTVAMLVLMSPPHTHTYRYHLLKLLQKMMLPSCICLSYTWIFSPKLLICAISQSPPHFCFPILLLPLHLIYLAFHSVNLCMHMIHLASNFKHSTHAFLSYFPKPCTRMPCKTIS